MLGKLFRYEFRNTAKIMLTIYGILIAVTILSSTMLSVSATSSSDTDMFFTFIIISSIILYVIAMTALVVVTYIYICTNFYKSMYSDQGYLTHTLPVSPVTTLNVKILVSLFWLFISMTLAILSMLLLISAVSRGELWELLFTMDFSKANQMFIREMGISIGIFLLEILIMAILSCLTSIMLVFTSISIGQLFHRHKGAASIIAGIVLYFAEQMISVILLLIIGIGISARTDYSLTTELPASFANTTMISTIALFSIFIIAYYIVCNNIVRKHINLD